MFTTTKTNISEAVRQTIDAMPIGYKFDGYQLRALVNARTKNATAKTYIDTLLRLARLYRRDQIRCINRHKSKYEKVAQ